MTEPTTPVEVALAVLRAYSSQDMETTARYLAADVVFDGPMMHLEGAEAYLKALEPFAMSVTGLDMIAALGDERQALIKYDIHTTRPYGTLRCMEQFVVENGRVTEEHLVYDSHELRKAMEAAAP